MPERRNPYINQRNSPSGNGDSECFSATNAMLASTYGGIDMDLGTYLKALGRHGSTTDQDAQIRTLNGLGFNARIEHDGNTQKLLKQLDAGRPVGVGYMHQPGSSGHWAVAHRREVDPKTGQTYIVLDDPYGQYGDKAFGGWRRENDRGGPGSWGDNARVPLAEFEKMWLDRGPNTGTWTLIGDKDADGRLALGPGYAAPAGQRPAGQQVAQRPAPAPAPASRPPAPPAGTRMIKTSPPAATPPAATPRMAGSNGIIRAIQQFAGPRNNSRPGQGPPAANFLGIPLPAVALPNIGLPWMPGGGRR